MEVMHDSQKPRTDAVGLQIEGVAPPKRPLDHESLDLFLWDGSGNQAMWIVPSKQLVVLRFGPTPKPKYGQPGEWDNSRIPNTVIRGLKAN